MENNFQNMETNFKLNDDTFKTPGWLYDLNPGIADIKILIQYLSHVPLSHVSSSWPGPMPMNPLENKGEELWDSGKTVPISQKQRGDSFRIQVGDGSPGNSLRNQHDVCQPRKCCMLPHSKNTRKSQYVMPSKGLGEGEEFHREMVFVPQQHF